MIRKEKQREDIIVVDATGPQFTPSAHPKTIITIRIYTLTISVYPLPRYSRRTLS